jgi:hypothetical protein
MVFQIFLCSFIVNEIKKKEQDVSYQHRILHIICHVTCRKEDLAMQSIKIEALATNFNWNKSWSTANLMKSVFLYSNRLQTL